MARQTHSIAGLMVLVFLVALALAFSRNAGSSGAWVFFLFLPLVSPWLVGPVLVKRTQWHAINTRYQDFDPENPDIPEALAGRIRQATSALADLGFTPRGHWKLENQAPSVTAYLSLFENRRTGVLAKFIAIEAPNAMPSTLVFATEYDDGTTLTTSNSRVPPVTPPVSIRPGSMSFPDVAGVRVLYEIHHARAEVAGMIDDPIGDDPLAYIEWVARVEKSGWVRSGYYSVDEVGGVLRPTWKGAFLMTWKFLWPVNSLRLALRRRRAARTMCKLGLSSRR